MTSRDTHEKSDGGRHIQPYKRPHPRETHHRNNPTCHERFIPPFLLPLFIQPRARQPRDSPRSTWAIQHLLNGSNKDPQGEELEEREPCCRMADLRVWVLNEMDRICG